MNTKFTKTEIDEFYSKVGKNVKEYRMKKNITQLQLAYAMGYKSVSLISAAELCKDKKHFNLEHIYKISKILKVDVCDLIK